MPPPAAGPPFPRRSARRCARRPAPRSTRCGSCTGRAGCTATCRPRTPSSCPAGRVEFIDYDLAQHDPGLPLPFPYRGGLVHVIAPELAARLLATGEDQHAELTPAAELFALGAALY
ncbi:hypothetical protein RM780_00175 [Streptomyces sp. DSM 44917]|uniref:Protein kinase domain-containing protein n=1 Tax=Streptomyces boetiae TaxID=3075541 RepID=A0ABU2L1K4_9ACTN|nr:hypothetical protein [Streptomyces sp. DSM 44917]MDT0305382.1 hypothetical protein [Streptomyces sp. DSM 44917]